MCLKTGKFKLGGVPNLADFNSSFVMSGQAQSTKGSSGRKACMLAMS